MTATLTRDMVVNRQRLLADITRRELRWLARPYETSETAAAYVEASAAYHPTDARSLDIFWGIASLLIAKGKAYEALKLNELKNTPGTIVAQRFAALPDAPPQNRRTTLQNEIARLADPKRRRILDDP